MNYVTRPVYITISPVVIVNVLRAAKHIDSCVMWARSASVGRVEMVNPGAAYFVN